MGADITVNRKAHRDYQIVDRIETGIKLKGTEIKSIRAGRCNANGAFARIERGELWAYDIDIQPYANASHEQHEPKRWRKLLVHKKELLKLYTLTHIKGNALPILRIYWKDSLVKIEVGVGKGKNVVDQREDIKKREADREISRFTIRGNKAE